MFVFCSQRKSFNPFPHQAEFQFGTRGPFAEADKSLAVSLAGFLSFFFYLMLILKSFPAYRSYVLENLSNTVPFNFTWLRNMLFALFGGLFILFAFKLLELINNGITYKTEGNQIIAGNSGYTFDHSG
jgi:hypothetical protein